MFKLITIKFKNLLVYLVNQVLFLLLKTVKQTADEKSLLIIRLDAIGDYVLFRNYLEILKQSSKYQGYKITLCGNSAWKELALEYDAKNVDSFLWIKRKKFYSDIIYRYGIFKQIRMKGFSTVVETTYTREILYGDAIARAANAPVRIGSSGSLEKYSFWKRKVFTNKTYSKLIELDESNSFEFYRNKEFFEKFLDEKILLTKPKFTITGINPYENIPHPYAVIFPGSNEPKRRWSPANFAVVAKFLLERDFNIVIAGGPGEENISKEIISDLNADKVFDLTGKNSISQLIKIIAGAEVVISNDSVATHISAAVDTKFICISSGVYWGRFNPYPKEIFKDAYFVYPDVLDANVNNKVFLEALRFSAPADINEVKPEKVFALLNRIIAIRSRENVK